MAEKQTALLDVVLSELGAEIQSEREQKRVILPDGTAAWTVYGHPEWCIAESRHRHGFRNKREWERIKREQKHACLHCGRSEPEIALTRDHIDPDGPNRANNIQGLCLRCNIRKARGLPLLREIQQERQS